ncbi:MAG: hypothetical protein QNJ40_15915 [Xanthomonadales bacterium]|nr:hypothetical protein [Xanthomonadales bacterium]
MTPPVTVLQSQTTALGDLEMVPASFEAVVDDRIFQSTFESFESP